MNETRSNSNNLYGFNTIAHGRSNPNDLSNKKIMKIKSPTTINIRNQGNTPIKHATKKDADEQDYDDNFDDYD